MMTISMMMITKKMMISRKDRGGLPDEATITTKKGEQIIVHYCLEIFTALLHHIHPYHPHSISSSSSLVMMMILHDHDGEDDGMLRMMMMQCSSEEFQTILSLKSKLSALQRLKQCFE